VIAVDANIISELSKPEPQERVVAWFRNHIAVAALPTPVVAEIYTGLAMLPDGRRKAAISAAYDEVCELMADRILPFDFPAAKTYAAIAVSSKRQGREMKSMDCLIAAIAAANRIPLATRNVNDFEFSGLDLINPWND
jgi:predicted nucleic acid-binding protein